MTAKVNEKKPMRGGTLYRIILAILGTILLLFSILILLFGFLTVASIPKDIGHDGSEIYYLVLGALGCALAVYLIRGAPHVTKFITSKEGRKK